MTKLNGTDRSNTSKTITRENTQMKSAHFRLLLTTMQKMLLLRETYFSCFSIHNSFRILSKNQSLIISDLMDTIDKFFRRSCWLEDLK